MERLLDWNGDKDRRFYRTKSNEFDLIRPLFRANAHAHIQTERITKSISLPQNVEQWELCANNMQITMVLSLFT